jgi:nitroreductase
MTLNEIGTMPPTAILDTIRGRRSASRFSPEPPPRAVVEQLIEAACWAPNHHLTEPWRFTVLAGGARAALGEVIAAELEQDAANPKAAAEAAGVRTKVMRSPVIIAVGQVRASSDPEQDLEDYAACSCATQNLLLAAHAAGLAAKWSTGKMAASTAAKRFLDLDPADRIVGYVYLGYPAEPPSPSRRRAAAELSRWLGWDSAAGDR